MCKNNIKLIYLTFIHCTYKFEKHKQIFLSEYYEQTFSNKNNKNSDLISEGLNKVGRPDMSCTRACYVGR
jgi:hypothetical protein